MADFPATADLKGRYLETVQLMERLHRQFLELVQTELTASKTDDVNSVQSLILHAIGRDELLVGDLIQRGYYLGTNVSYNVRKLVEGGYLAQERSPHDRRSVRVRLSDKGLALCRMIDAMFNRQLDAVNGLQLGPDLKSAAHVYRLLERFWIGQIGYSRTVPRD